MAHPISVRHKAIALRRRGYSLKEISERFCIAKSTASLWMDNIVLDGPAQKRLLTMVKKGQLVSARKKRMRTVALEEQYFAEAREEMSSRPDHDKILCAMIYWCEGAKSARSGVMFTNSDPSLVASFLRLLRSSFTLDEGKFRVCIHLHSYHKAKKQLDFWSKITDIDRRQFIKPYRKVSTGRYSHKDYEGCVSIRYYSSDVARRLIAVAKAFLTKKGA